MDSQNNKSKGLNYLKIKKADLFFVTAVLLIAGIAVIFMLRQKNGDTVNIYIEGAEYEYSLYENREIKLTNNHGGHNTIVIDNGQVYMREADCPNQVCVNHKPIYRNGESIVCVPNKVSIDVVSKIEKEIDN